MYIYRGRGLTLSAAPPADRHTYLAAYIHGGTFMPAQLYLALSHALVQARGYVSTLVVWYDRCLL